jgi:hypothetical protein
MDWESCGLCIANVWGEFYPLPASLAS